MKTAVPGEQLVAHEPQRRPVTHLREAERVESPTVGGLQGRLHLGGHLHQLRAGHTTVDALDKDPGADGVSHRPERRPRVARTPRGRLLLREGRGQPFADLIGHGLALQLGQVVLGLVPKLSARSLIISR